jgi:hypothetical protein
VTGARIAESFSINVSFLRKQVERLRETVRDRMELDL